MKAWDDDGLFFNVFGTIPKNLFLHRYRIVQKQSGPAKNIIFIYELYQIKKSINRLWFITESSKNRPHFQSINPILKFKFPPPFRQFFLLTQTLNTVSSVLYIRDISEIAKDVDEDEDKESLN